MTYEDIKKSSDVVLVEFYAAWCPHCRRMMPVVEQVSELLEGTAVIRQFDIDQYDEIARNEDVSGVPTFLLYVDGNEVWRHSGEIDGQALLSKVQHYAASR